MNLIDKKTTRPCSSASGFTLIEMVTAAAIFSILGVMLFGMVQSGMTMWKNGEAARTEMERGVRILETVSKELRLIFTQSDPISNDSSVQMICDFVDFDRDGNSEKEMRVQRLMFVRINTEERENELIRNSGDLSLGKHHFTLFQQDKDILDEEGTLPTGGLAESVFMSYAPRLQPKEKRTGQLGLYRGYRSPIGGEDSYFSAGRLDRTSDVESNLICVQDGLLYLEFRFWSSSTVTFDENLVKYDSPEGAGYTWDSTRSYLTNRREDMPNIFPFYVSEESRNDVSDDIYPSKVKITVVVEDPQRNFQLPKLIADIRKDDMRITLDIIKPFEMVAENDRFIRIDEEWIEYSDLDGQDMIIKKRGARNTIPAAHKEESRIHYGYAVSTVVEIPTARSCWNDEND